MAAEGGSGSSSRERTTSGQRAKNERRTISKFPASIDLRQVFFFILPNIRTAFLSPPLVTFYLPRSTRDGESGSVSRPHFRPSIFPAPRLSARLSAPRLSQPLDFPPLDFSSRRQQPHGRLAPAPQISARLSAPQISQPLDSPPDFTQPKRFVFSHKRRVRPHKPPPSSRTALGGGEGFSRQQPPAFMRRLAPPLSRRFPLRLPLRCAKVLSHKHRPTTDRQARRRRGARPRRAQGEPSRRRCRRQWRRGGTTEHARAQPHDADGCGRAAEGRGLWLRGGAVQRKPQREAPSVWRMLKAPHEGGGLLAGDARKCRQAQCGCWVGACVGAHGVCG